MERFRNLFFEQGYFYNRCVPMYVMSSSKVGSWEHCERCGEFIEVLVFYKFVWVERGLVRDFLFSIKYRPGFGAMGSLGPRLSAGGVPILKFIQRHGSNRGGRVVILVNVARA